ncbi:TIGR04282 family arsenosugar biosynthesis glycosyltransferase [Pedobacter sp. UYP30]|uniref:TIGR04282 family arsenosugar biosynthesis glycosyltransferase n=1 Tax=Pedobacter sp. UYP30 TaxID=1756400 RepID=UPI00339158D3
MDNLSQKSVAIIIFVRHPELGKVKTRLAKSIGNEKALQVYTKLLQHTLEITKSIDAAKFVFYTEEIQENDLWSEKGYWKCKQKGTDLGERMKNAFSFLFEQGFKQVLIIGSDCYQLTSKAIEQAIKLLDESDLVLGPAVDGGYYLLGMSKLYSVLFENKTWSTDSVAAQTLQDAEKLDLKVVQLQALFDVDEFDDLVASGMQID